MSSTQPIAMDGNGKEGEAMGRRTLGRGSRLAAVAFTVALVFSLAGDRGRAATGTSVVNGQDPLEVLALKIRPNVFVVLDSSGSMTSTVTETQNTRSGDHPRSKMFQAKQVLSSVVQQNQDKASFLFGTYTQLDESGGSYFSLLPSNLNEGNDRIQYSTSSDLSPNMVGFELGVRRTLNDTSDRGFQSWQIIDAQWNTVHFEEDSNTSGPVTASCAAVVPGPYPRFFQTGAALATALQTAMNAAGCSGQTNTYSVSYNTGNGQFTFNRTGGSPTQNWRIVWGRTPNNIRNALAETSTGTTGWQNPGSVVTDAPWTLLFRNGTGSSGTGMNTDYQFQEEIPRGSGTFVTFYQLRAGRLWNGETIKVQADGTICGLTFATPADKTNPPSVKVQLVANSCGADIVTNPDGTPGLSRFTFAGVKFAGNNRNCRGFQPTVALIPCDLQSPPAPLQITTIDPFIETELRFNPDGSPRDYSEVQDGGWKASYTRPGLFTDSAKAAGNTPIANTLIDILGLAESGGGNCFDPVDGTTANCQQRGFDKLWNVGQAGSGSSTGAPPYQLDAIKNHVDPKEKTIVLFVTDGDDTCYNRGDSGSSSNMDDNARRTAYWAEKLYTRKVATDAASSVDTYVIGFGGGTPYRLDWIAWGGSGLGQGLAGQPQVPVTGGTDAYPPTNADLTSNVRWNGNDAAFRTLRANCTTCRDAFLAPDADTLAAQLQAIIDQGAQIGEFSSQQSLTQSVFEYADVGGKDASWPTPIDISGQPRGGGRYSVLVPTRIVSTFSLPGFHGQLRAYQNVGGVAVEQWDAGETLRVRVANGMAACDTTSGGGGVALCGFVNLHGGASDSTIWSSAARIKRRIYTTERNGVYTFDPTSLMAATANSRVSLWPPDSSVAPTSYLAQGSLDVELGLPADSPTCVLDPIYTSCAEQELARLKAQFNACVGANLPSECTSGSTLSQMRAARREAREMILAFMAGAKGVPAYGGGGVQRTSSTSGSVPSQSILYQVREWILADSQLATPAVIAPPLSVPPAVYTDEYTLMRDGPRNAGGTNPDSAGVQLYQGFGLRNPDSDGGGGDNAPDSRVALKPAMTVVFAPANDMLHAFRAGPNCSPALGTCTEFGGDELWGFVPYDQLAAVSARLANDPQGRDNHVYMLARGVRFADVFVPELPGPLTNVNVGGVTVPSMQGVWRRILYFGRGIGGKHVTALDVTGTGPFTQESLRTAGPIPLWSRGNPDSTDGTASGSDSGTVLDRMAYARMGETWSMPTVAYINRAGLLYQTPRRPDGVEFVLLMGSGYGGPGEGSTFFTLDALSGDVIGAADVEAAASSAGLTRSNLGYPNALVANVVGFNPSAFPVLQTVHPAGDYVRRVYFGDVHGRFWKVLTAEPDVAIPVADLGEDQPVGTAASLLGMPPSVPPPPVPPPNDSVIPFVYVSSGNDLRVDGPFTNFAFRDDGSNTDTTVGAGVPTSYPDGSSVTTFPPSVALFARHFDQGVPDASCGYTEEAFFRGTVQPATTFECATIVGGVCTTPIGRAFYAGTRLSLPNTKFAPPTPFACGIGDYPCRSQFDSIIYALGAVTGQAAYDLNASGDDAYRIFRDSRIAAIGMQADPDPARGGSSFAADEGLVKGTPDPPPPPGVPPTSTTATASVIMTRSPGQPPPAVRYGSTVCQ